MLYLQNRIRHWPLERFKYKQQSPSKECLRLNFPNIWQPWQVVHWNLQMLSSFHLQMMNCYLRRTPSPIWMKQQPQSISDMSVSLWASTNPFDKTIPVTLNHFCRKLPVLTQPISGSCGPFAFVVNSSHVIGMIGTSKLSLILPRHCYYCCCCCCCHHQRFSSFVSNFSSKVEAHHA